MKKHLAIIVLLVWVAGCSTTKPPPDVPIPKSWSQTENERGKLLAGKVVAVKLEVLTIDQPRPKVANPLTLVKIGDQIFGDRWYPRFYATNQQFYRYTVVSKRVSEPLFWDDFSVYPIGSCIALREEMQLIVPALAEECE